MKETDFPSEGPEIGTLEKAGLDPAEAQGTRKVIIDLSNPRDGEKFTYSGDILAVQKLDGHAEVRFTKSGSFVSLSSFPAVSRTAGFDQFYIRNEAQPGSELVVQVGGQAGVSLGGVRSNVAVINTKDVQVDPAQRAGWPNLNYGHDTATTAGEVTLNSGGSLVIPHEAHLKIKAFTDNSGLVYLGDVDGVGSSSGYPLSPGESISVQITDVGSAAFYSNNSGDGVAWIVETE